MSTANESPDDSRAQDRPTTPLPPSVPTPAQLEALLRSNNSPLTRNRPSAEQRDERCWTTAKQTNARRALHREPQTTMYCYMNFRHAIADLIPVPGIPGAYLARDVATPAASSASPAPTPAAAEDDLPAYRWPSLDGRYFYVARGNEAVKKHLEDMKLGTSVEDISARCEKAREEREAMGVDKYGRKRRQMPSGSVLQMREDEESFDYPSYERLYSLSDVYSNSLRRFHAHIIRIYSPGLANLARLPSTITDGTQTRMFDTVYERLTDGSAYKLAERLMDATVRVTGTLLERRKERENSGGNGSGSSGGFGGIGGLGGIGGPPLGGPPKGSSDPPPTDGPPSAGAGPGWGPPPPPPTAGPIPPNAVGCTVM